MLSVGNPDFLAHGLVISGGYTALAARCVAATLERATQAEDTHPRRTWRDYAGDRDFDDFFRFQPAEIEELTACLQLPDVIRTPKRFKFSPDEAVSILLFMFARGPHHSEVNRMFGRKRSAQSELMTWWADFFWDNWYGPLLASDLRRWTPHFQLWADTIFAKQGHARGYRNVVGFIDGTLRGIARPSQNQDMFFSGHKWFHGLKFQAFTAPNGLTIDLAGPLRGRRSDEKLLAKSRLLPRFREACSWAGCLYDFVIFADAGYAASVFLMTPFKRIAGTSTVLESTVNLMTSKVRVAVEWGYGRTANLWKHIDDSARMVTGLRQPAKLYVIATILTNAHTCAYGNITSQEFGLQPPSMREYFDGAPAAAAADYWDSEASD